jgi:F-type H+-transporting ATPase subunit gamma
MPSLKDLKVRIGSVKSTQKITSAMKMVAASKLRRAQEAAEAARPYAEAMGRVITSLAANIVIDSDSPTLLVGTGQDRRIVLVVITSDRGLCGAFNANVVRETRNRIRTLVAEGREVQIITVGRKGRDALRRDYARHIIHSYEDIGRRGLRFDDAHRIIEHILSSFAQGNFDRCELIYNHFKSVIAQITQREQLIPTALPQTSTNISSELKPLYSFEPAEEELLAALLPRNLAVQLYKALLDSAAGEQAARMTAMDNATRNAGDMIRKLTLTYNRTRQAYITKELIEIISGAEAV